MPPRITIGVTGHRILRNTAELSARVHSVLEQIIQNAAPASPSLRALSPLAEGADRLVAREVLRFSGAELQAVLPLAKADYLKDFKAPASREEFEELLARADRVVELSPARSRSEAYLQAGRYVVDHCDILIALWNGQSAAGRGGTAEIVEYARRQGRALYWIHTADPKCKTDYGLGAAQRPEPS